MCGGAHLFVMMLFVCFFNQKNFNKIGVLFVLVFIYSLFLSLLSLSFFDSSNLPSSLFNSSYLAQKITQSHCRNHPPRPRRRQRLLFVVARIVDFVGFTLDVSPRAPPVSQRLPRRHPPSSSSSSPNETSESESSAFFSFFAGAGFFAAAADFFAGAAFSSQLAYLPTQSLVSRWRLR